MVTLSTQTEIVTANKKSIIIPILFLLYANTVDALCTDYGLRLGVIEEGNYLMEIVYNQSILYFYTIKLLGVALGLTLLYNLTKRLKTKPKYLPYAIYSAIGVYLIALTLHIIWLTTYAFITFS